MNMRFEGYRLESLLDSCGSVSIHGSLRVFNAQCEQDGSYQDAFVFDLSGQALLQAWLSRDIERRQSLRVSGIENRVVAVQAGERRAVFLPKGEGTRVDRLIGNGKVDGQLALKIFVQAAHVLNEVHKQGQLIGAILPSRMRYCNKTQQLCFGFMGFAAESKILLNSLHHPWVLRCFLPYISPEKSGRLGWTPDFRSDLYSLGVLAYELFSGTLPIVEADPYKLIHLQLTKAPPRLQDCGRAIPMVIIRIIARLLEKHPERRYSSAQGLLYDLQRVVDIGLSVANLSGIELAERDHPDRLSFPFQLYGREDESKQLAACYHRLCTTGGTELVILHGSSGSGRAALANEVRQLALQHRGYYASGFYRPQEPRSAYSGWIQAMRDLVTQLMGESGPRLRRMRARLRERVGTGLAQLALTIPELQLVVGEQSRVVEDGPFDTGNQLKRHFQELLAVFAEEGHPLTICLQDFHRADVESLEFVRDLAVYNFTHPLLLILSVSGEVGDVKIESPLQALPLFEINNAGVNVQELSVEGWKLASVCEFLAATLTWSLSRAEPLAEWLLPRTGGNSQHVRAYVEHWMGSGALHRSAAGHWEWNKLNQKMGNSTLSVVEIYLERLSKLSDGCCHLIKIASCLGFEFYLDDLSVADSKSAVAVLKVLEPAIQGQVIEVNGRKLRFTSSKMGLAAVSMFTEQERRSMHLNIGRRLLAESAVRPIAESQITRQLNQAVDLIRQPDQILELVNLNLEVGAQYRRMLAYDQACENFQMGIQLLGAVGWSSHSEINLQLHQGLIDVMCLSGKFGKSGLVLDGLLDRCRTIEQRVQVQIRRIRHCVALGDDDDAVKIGLQAVAEFDIELPDHRDATAVDRCLNNHRTLQNSYTGEIGWQKFLERPISECDRTSLCCQILAVMAECFRSSFPKYVGVLAGELIASNIRSGLTCESAYALCCLAANRLNFDSDCSVARDMAETSLRLSRERVKNAQYDGMIHVSHAHIVGSLSRPIKDLPKLFDTVYLRSLESGDHVWAAMAAESAIRSLTPAGVNLAETSAQYRDRLPQLDLMDKPTADIARLGWAVVRVLRGDFEWGCDGLMVKCADFDLPAMVDRNKNQSGDFHAWHRYCDIRLSYFMGDRRRAFELSQYIVDGDLGCFVEGVEQSVCACLAALSQRQQGHLSVDCLNQFLTEKLGCLRSRASYCPSNYEAQLALVEAVLASTEGSTGRAVEFFERALAAAENNQHIALLAEVREHYAEFWMSLERPEVARLHLLAAIEHFQHWGAAGKVKALEREHYRLLENVINSGMSNPMDSVNIGAISALRTVHAISDEVRLDKVIDRVLAAALEHTGAQRALLILDREGCVGVEAERTAGAGAVHYCPPIPFNSAQRMMACSVASYVMQTGNPVVLSDAQHERPYSQDRYVYSSECLSLMCVAIRRQHRRIGALYLENNLSSGMFSQDLVELLKLLLVQAATSLENAYLYEALREGREELAITLDSIAESVIAVDEHLQIVRMNPAAEELTGWDRYDAIGNRLSAVVKFLDKDGDREDVHLIEILNGEEQKRDRRPRILQAKDGAERLVMGTASPINDRDGGVTGVVLVLRDVTEEQRLSASLRQSQKMEAIGQLAGGVAHDFNNLLCGIMGYSDLLLDGMDSNSVDIELVEGIRKASFRAADLTSKLLTFSRRSPMKNEAFEISGVIEEVIGLLKRTLGTRIDVEYVRSQKLLAIVGDSSQIQGAILNLAVNARDAMPGGGKIDLRSEFIDLSDEECTSLALSLEAGAYCHIQIRDNGVGMSESVCARIFEPFFTTKEVGKGTGLGLAAAYGAVMAHRGALTCESKLGVGTCFHIYLPAVLQEASIQDKTVSNARSGAAGGHILVVDDESSNRSIAYEMLVRLGYEVVVARDGEEALEAMRSGDGFDLVLLDAMMPTMSGSETFKALRLLNPTVRIVICSGAAQEGELRELMACEVDGFLQKPFGMADLSLCISNTIRVKIDADQ